ncbi:putative ZIP zinc transporter [Cryptosporidium canis]|uniref:ZIP zinc transporter n=1 Tax=Cryptosporidium canis TaxID=195482 RepID=A0ABQ8P7G3_9CRYT|nr:putative ZIP zinc transporter [Cryptosporidium canis]KAJ1610426.1 putative ZIP zinc transporter [Cryptosporidium canis]
MNLFWHKLACSILLFLSAILGYFFPAGIDKSERSKNRKSKILPVLTAFGAGAFIALAIVHLIPDAIEDSSSGLLSFHIAGIEVNCVCYLILTGFLFSLISESLADEYFGGHGHMHDHHKCQIRSSQKENVNSNVMSTNVSSGENSDEDSFIIDEFEADASINRENSSLCTTSSGKDQCDLSSKKDKTVLSENVQMASTGSSSTSIGFVLVSALFFHSLFEGMIVGTSRNILDTWVITAVIFAHKWIEILIVYMTLVSKGVNPVVYIIILSFGSPVGAMIGATVIITSSVASAVCSALAAGTILYVACIEVIPDVFNDKHSIGLPLKLASFIAGITTVSFLTLAGDIVENSY